MFEIKGLTLKTGTFTLEGIELTVKEHLSHVVIGPTGCGKTTLLEAIMGLRKLTKGEIWLNGREITHLPVEKRGISYLPQDLALFPHLSVKDNIFYGLRIRREREKQFYELAGELIDGLGITHILSRPIHNLSGGERQRVALIRALATGNRCLLLDEPFSALHEGMKKELLFLIKDLQERYKLIIIMVTHDIAEALFLGDTLSIMIDGTIHQTGAKGEVYKYPKTLEAARFFGIRNLFEVEVIESADDKMIVACDELNCSLTIPHRRFTDSSIHHFTIGIRAEDVMIMRPDLKRHKQDNLLTGTITEIYEKGASHIVLFLPQGSQRNIEIEMPDYALHKLNLFKGQSSAIFLKRERIFLTG